LRALSASDPLTPTHARPQFELRISQIYPFTIDSGEPSRIPGEKLNTRAVDYTLVHPIEVPARAVTTPSVSSSLRNALSSPILAFIWFNPA
jgi:hypothetical protein